jgi:hypothetical protein
MRQPAFAGRIEAQIRAGRIERAPSAHRRPQGLAMLAMAACIAVLAGFLVVASHSIPGDGLYALKRAGETAQLSVTWGSTEAHVRLSLAETRLQEVQGLFARARNQVQGVPGTIAAGGPTDGMDPHIAKLIRQTLREAEVQINAAAKILIADHSDRLALQRLVTVAHRGSSIAKGVAATLPSLQKPPVLNTADNLAIVATKAEAVRQEIPAGPTPTPCVTASPSPSRSPAPSASPSASPAPASEKPAQSPSATPTASAKPASPRPSSAPCVTPTPSPSPKPSPTATPSSSPNSSPAANKSADNSPSDGQAANQPPSNPSANGPGTQPAS